MISELTVPANANEADAIALDIDGDGDPENALGGLLGALSGFVGDIPAVVQEQVNTGGIILLANLKATDLTAADGVGLYVYLGNNPFPAPCASDKDTECGLHLQGDATFEISPDSPTDAVIVGVERGRQLHRRPRRGDHRAVAVRAGRSADHHRWSTRQSTVDVAADALTGGKLGGAITIDSINNDLLPAVAVVIEGILTEEKCTRRCARLLPGGLDRRDHHQPARRGFQEGTNDCVITAEELANNALVSSTIGNPDLDLDPRRRGQRRHLARRRLQRGHGHLHAAAASSGPRHIGT